MEALTAAVLFIVVQTPGRPPLHLEQPLPLSECLEEARLILRKNYDIEAGASIQAGCIVTVAPSIQH